MSRLSTLTLAILVVISTPARGELRLSDIIKKVRENEKLYQNIEVVMEETYDIGDRKPMNPASIGGGTAHQVIRTQSKLRYVSQGKWFRLEREGTKQNTQKTSSLDRIRAYDGETTRVLDRNAIGNISKERLEDPAFVRPHTLAIRYVDLPVPFSVYLSGDKAIRAHPNASWPKNLSLVATYEGEEKCRDLNCHKIVVTSLTKSGHVSTRKEFWLAEDRNYLPVQRVLYTPSRSNDISNNETFMSDLREIEPGIWFPFDVETTAYNKFAIQRDGVQNLQWQEQYKVERVDLNPDYDRKFFSNVEFPEGATVYKVENGKIKESWRQGAPASPDGSSKGDAK